MSLARRDRWALLFGALLGLHGCGPSTSGGGRTRLPDPNGGADLTMVQPFPEGDMAQPAGPGWDGGIDPGPGKPDTCHEQKFAPMSIADPDILLIMDMSGSMTEGSPSKYKQTSDAIAAVITQLEQKKAPIYWGLEFFPADGDCGVKPPQVPVAAGKAMTVVNTIKNTAPRGNTPMTAAIDTGAAYFSGLKDNRSHFILLATDGEPNCENGGGLPKICMSDKDCAKGETCQILPFFGGLCVPAGGVGPTSMAVAAARAKGIKTYVVGISLGGVSATLNALADAGGTARQGNTKYYPVTDQLSLEAALRNITSQIISCTFKLSSLPQQNQDTVVEVNGVQVKQDKNHMEGWDIDVMAKTLTLYGKACATLQQNPGGVTIGYTCPPPGATAGSPSL